MDAKNTGYELVPIILESSGILNATISRFIVLLFNTSASKRSLIMVCIAEVVLESVFRYFTGCDLYINNSWIVCLFISQLNFAAGPE